MADNWDLWREPTLVGRALEDADIGLYVDDYEQVKKTWCPRARAIFGVGPHFVPDDETFMGLVHPSDFPLLLERATAAHQARDEASYWVEFRLRPTERAPQERWVRATSRLVRDAQGRVIREEGTIRDITRERKVVDALARTQRQHDLGRLAGSVAHDFNNFLTVMLAEAQLARMEDDLSPAVAAAFDSIEASVQKASVLTQQLLGYAKRQVRDARTISVSAALNDMTRLLRRMVPESHGLHYELAPGAWPVRIDPSHLQQVMMNLVLNAAQASPEDGAIVVRVQAAPDSAPRHPGLTAGAYVVVSVQDHGRGIAPAELASIFEPFFTTRPSGTGLGLPTCRELVERAGGVMEVDSALGVGTTMKVILPLLSEHDLREAAESGDATPIPSAAGSRVLVVEDDAEVRALTARSLRAFGHRTWEARDGDDLLEQLHAVGEGVDVVVTDVVMPGTPIHEVRTVAASRFPAVRFLFASGYPGVRGAGDDVSTLLRSGDGFIAKPFTPAMISHRVREIANTEL